MTPSDVERFWSRVDRAGPCWRWTGAAHGFGYGRFWTKTHGEKGAHRYAFYLAHGRWPAVCRHACDTPACVNPAHLQDGTAADNVHDCVDRGRHVAWNARKTHCPKGHAYDEINTRMYDGRRYCRACMALVNARLGRRRRDLAELK